MMKINHKFKLKAILVITLFIVGWVVGMYFPSRTRTISTISLSADDDPLLSIGECEFQVGNFESELENLVKQWRFSIAVGLLIAAKTDELVQTNPCRYYTVEGFQIPGGYRLPKTNAAFDPSRDWVMPASGHDSGSMLWRDLCEVFAGKHNKAIDVRKKTGPR